MSEFYREISDGVIEGFCIDIPFPCLGGWISYAGEKQQRSPEFGKFGPLPPLSYF